MAAFRSPELEWKAAMPLSVISWRFAMKRLYRVYLLSMVFVLTITMMMPSSFAVDDMWTVANNLIVDLYSQIVKISTVLGSGFSGKRSNRGVSIFWTRRSISV